MLACLQLGLLVAGNGALDETVGAGLGGVDLGVLAGVLGALVPAKVYKIVSTTSLILLLGKSENIPISK